MNQGEAPRRRICLEPRVILILIEVLTLILIWGRTPMRMVLGFSCLMACRNMGVNLKFHASNTFLCLQAFGNVGGG